MDKLIGKTIANIVLAGEGPSWCPGHYTVTIFFTDGSFVELEADSDREGGASYIFSEITNPYLQE